MATKEEPEHGHDAHTAAAAIEESAEAAAAAPRPRPRDQAAAAAATPSPISGSSFRPAGPPITRRGWSRASARAALPRSSRTASSLCRGRRLPRRRRLLTAAAAPAAAVAQQSVDAVASRSATCSVDSKFPGRWLVWLLLVTTTMAFVFVQTLSPISVTLSLYFCVSVDTGIVTWENCFILF